MTIVNASWQGRSPYTPPASDAVDASWLTEVSGRIAVPSPLGAPAVLGTCPVVGLASAPSPLGAPELLGTALPEAVGLIEVPGPLGAPSVLGQHVVAGRAAAPSPLSAPTLVGDVVVVGRAAVPSPLGTPVVLAEVLRYELRGAVRQGGVALARRVRAHRLSDGALLGEADTIAGKCRVPAGFVDGELCYLVPLDMSAEATDYAPVAANRVAAVLADDLAEIPV